MIPPSVLVEVAVEPRRRQDQAVLLAALLRRVALSPGLGVTSDDESGQIMVGGLSEGHLAAELNGLRQTSGLGINVGAPQASYRKTLTRRVEQDYTHKKQTGGTGQFARLKIVFEPNEAGAGNLFESRIIGGAVPENYVLGVRRGIDAVFGAGILAGYPVVDVKATLIDGAFHDVDSSALAFEIASRAAFRGALQKGGSVLLEPIMKVELVTLEEYTVSCVGDLISRRGQIQGRHVRGDADVIVALVPLADMFGYADRLRSLSQGRATFATRLDHYAPRPTPDDGGLPPTAAAALRV